jgi:hypothetical protein
MIASANSPPQIEAIALFSILMRLDAIATIALKILRQGFSYQPSLQSSFLPREILNLTF